MSDEYSGDEERYPHPYEGGYENHRHPYQAGYQAAYPQGDGDTHGAGFAPGEGVWQPLAYSGEFDAEATMSTQFAGTFDFQSLATGGQPLAAPGHGYVPQPHPPQDRPAPHEAYASPPQEGAAWHPAAGHVPPQAEEQAAAEQWSVPFAPEDPAEESGDYSVGVVVTPPPAPQAQQAAHYPDPYASYAGEPYRPAERTQEFAVPPLPAQTYPDAPAPDYAGDAVPPQGYAEDPVPPQGYAEDAVPPQGYAEDAVPPQGYAEDAVPGFAADPLTDPLSGSLSDPLTDPLTGSLPDLTGPLPESGAESESESGLESGLESGSESGSGETELASDAGEFTPHEPPSDGSPAAEAGPVEDAGAPGAVAEPEAAEPGAPQAEPGADLAAAAPAPDADEPPGESAPSDPHSEHPTASYVLTVNGTEKPVTGAWLGESLLYVLRERLGLAGAKDGCEQGECGACSVQVDGRLVASCLVPAATAAGSEVRTVEGLARDGHPSDVQRALAECGAVQCGFCVPGMAMTVHDLLEGNHRPTELQTRAALAGNLCRCSGYQGVLAAVDRVAAEREAAHEAEREAERAAGHEGGHDPYAAGHDLFGGDAAARIPHQSTGEPDGASS